MKMVLRRKSSLLACVLILLAVSLGIIFAGDVVVKEGDMDVEGNLNAKGDMDVEGNLNAKGDMNVEGNLNVIGSICIEDGGLSSFETYGCGWIQQDAWVGYDLSVMSGKVYSAGGYDPPYVLYDQQTRQQIIDRIKMEIPPKKQAGAALFFNADTHRLETYVPSEGKFCNLDGNLLYTLPKPDIGTKYEVIYYLDTMTGEVKTMQKSTEQRWRTKKGYFLDGHTGNFYDIKTKQQVEKSVAVELITN